MQRILLLGSPRTTLTRGVVGNVVIVLVAVHVQMHHTRTDTHTQSETRPRTTTRIRNICEFPQLFWILEERVFSWGLGCEFATFIVFKTLFNFFFLLGFCCSKQLLLLLFWLLFFLVLLLQLKFYFTRNLSTVDPVEVGDWDSSGACPIAFRLQYTKAKAKNRN